MKNEYNEPLDRNGYSKSLIHDSDCLICGATETVRHEIYHASDRQKSKRYGAWVTLCPRCHRRVHNGFECIDKDLKEFAQPILMNHYGWSIDDFRKHFRKNYLEVEA